MKFLQDNWLYLTCHECKSIDIVLKKKAKDWTCNRCAFEKLRVLRDIAVPVIEPRSIKDEEFVELKVKSENRWEEWGRYQLRAALQEMIEEVENNRTLSPEWDYCKTVISTSIQYLENKAMHGK